MLILILHPDRHLFNDIYEKILSDLQSAGNAGEYYTPRGSYAVYGRYYQPQLGETMSRLIQWYWRVLGQYH